MKKKRMENGRKMNEMENAVEFLICFCVFSVFVILLLFFVLFVLCVFFFFVRGRECLGPQRKEPQTVECLRV